MCQRASGCVWLCLAVSLCFCLCLRLCLKRVNWQAASQMGGGGGLSPFFDLSTNRLNFRKPVKQLQMNGIPVANSPDGKRPNQSAELKHARQVPCNTRG